MLQFVNSTVFLSKTSTQKKIFVDKKMYSNNLTKTSSYTNLKVNLQEKTPKSTFQIETYPKRSMKQQMIKKSVKQRDQLRKPFQNIDNKHSLVAKKSQYSQKSNIFLNSLQKQNIRSFQPTIIDDSGSKKQKQEGPIIIKKRYHRPSNTIHRKKQNSVLIKKSPSFVKRQLNFTVKKFAIQQKQQLPIDRRNLQKEELYYVDELKRQIKKIDLFDEDNDQLVPMIVGHFFQSISTFYRFKEIKQPDEPKISVFLPKQKKFKTTLIFDMDQTLIHAQPYQKDVHSNTWGQNFEVTIDDGSKVMINMKIRPFVMEVLQRLKNRYQIGVFTAANQIYAKQILAKIDPSGKIFDFQLFRQHCDVIEGKLAIKDLRILSNRSIKNIILIDNSPHTYLYQQQNAIPIISFFNDLKDKEMLKIENFLKIQGMDKKQDVRIVLKTRFQLHKYVQYDSMEQLIDNLYGQKA